MLFSERQKLEKEYYKWLEENPNVKPCPFSLISFLDGNGNLVEKEEKSNFQNLHIAFEMACRDLLSSKHPKIDYTDYKPKATMKSYIRKARNFSEKEYEI